jgi:hypothetical protein
VDAPRRWQVASLATAVTSLGIGGLIVSRPSVEPVAPIVLDVRASADEDPAAVDLDDVDGATTPEVVAPDGAGADVVTPETPASLTSIDSPAEPTRSTSPAPSPSPTANSSPTTRTAPADDSPASVDTVDSVDSDD